MSPLPWTPVHLMKPLFQPTLTPPLMTAEPIDTPISRRMENIMVIPVITLVLLWPLCFWPISMLISITCI